jgi:hypothetical protein
VDGVSGAPGWRPATGRFFLHGVQRGKRLMQTPNSRIDDRPSPLTFVVPAGLIGGLVWICTLLARMAP